MEQSVGRAFIDFIARTGTVDSQAKSGIQKQGKDLATAMAAGAGAVKIFQFGKDAVAESQIAQKAIKQTEAVLKSTGGVAGVTSGQIDKLTKSIEGETAVNDVAVRAGANLLLTFTNLRNVGEGAGAIFDRTTKIMVDMSAAMGTDAKASAIQLGKALNDPIRGVSALAEVGVAFTDQQREQIKVMQESGDIAGAQALILKELETEFGGSAAAQKTSADELNVAIGNLKEEIGTALTPAIEGAAKAAAFLVEGFTALPEPMQGVVTVGAGIVLGSIAIAKTYEAVSGTLDTLNDAYEKVAQSQLAHAAATKLGSGAAATAGVSVGSITPALVGVGAALVVGAVAWQQYNAAEGARDKLRGQFVKDLEETGSTARSTIPILQEMSDSFTSQDLADLSIAVDSGTDSFESLGVTLAGIVGTTANAEDQLDQLHDAVKAGSVDTSEYNQLVLNMVDAHKLNVEEALELVDQLDALADRRDEAGDNAQKAAEAEVLITKAMEDSAGATEFLTEGTDAYKEAIKNVADEQDAFNDQVEDARDAVQEYADTLVDADTATQDFMESQFNLDRVVRDLANDQRNLKKALDESGGSLDNTTEKGGRAAEATERLFEDFAQAAAHAYEMTGGGAAFQDAMAGIADGLVTAGREAGLTNDQIFDLLEKLNAAEGNFDAHLEVHVDRAAYDAFVKSLGKNFAVNINAAGVAFGAKGGTFVPVDHYALGGVTQATGGLAVVGELGPELVQFGGTSAVFPHNQFQREMNYALSQAITGLEWPPVKVIGAASEADLREFSSGLLERVDHQFDRLDDEFDGVPKKISKDLEHQLGDVIDAVDDWGFTLRKAIVGVGDILAPGLADFLADIDAERRAKQKAEDAADLERFLQSLAPVIQGEAAGGAFTGPNDGLWRLHRNETILNEAQMNALLAAVNKSVPNVTLQITVDGAVANAPAVGRAVGTAAAITLRRLVPDVRGALVGG